MKNNKVYCPNCKKEILNLDHFLGLCDECLNLDKVAPARTIEEGLTAIGIKDDKEKLLADKRDKDIKSLYAQLYDRGFSKEKVKETITNLCDIVGAWSVSRLDDNQISIIGKFINYYGANL